MKIILVALFAVALASAFPQAPIYAQDPPPGQPYIQIPIPGMPGFGQQPPGGPPGGRERGDYGEFREHCERLRDREHDIRERLAYAPPYGEERQRLEQHLREVHYERERCRGR
jgi:hypothetical protein